MYPENQNHQDEFSVESEDGERSEPENAEVEEINAEVEEINAEVEEIKLETVPGLCGIPTHFIAAIAIVSTVALGISFSLLDIGLKQMVSFGQWEGKDRTDKAWRMNAILPSILFYVTTIVALTSSVWVVLNWRQESSPPKLERRISERGHNQV